MNYIQASNRHKLSFGSLEDTIEQDNPAPFNIGFIVGFASPTKP